MVVDRFGKEPKRVFVLARVPSLEGINYLNPYRWPDPANGRWVVFARPQSTGFNSVAGSGQPVHALAENFGLLPLFPTLMHVADRQFRFGALWPMPMGF